MNQVLRKKLAKSYLYNISHMSHVLRKKKLLTSIIVTYTKFPNETAQEIVLWSETILMNEKCLLHPSFSVNPPETTSLLHHYNVAQ